MIIDKTLPSHSDISASLEGEILLERTYSTSGECTGVITTSIETLEEMKQHGKAKRTELGWDKYGELLDGITAGDIASAKLRRSEIHDRRKTGGVTKPIV